MNNIEIIKNALKNKNEWEFYCDDDEKPYYEYVVNDYITLQLYCDFDFNSLKSKTIVILFDDKNDKYYEYDINEII